MRILISLLLGFSFSVTLFSQSSRYVITSGKSVIKVPIEEITIHIEVQSTNRSSAEANSSLRETVLRVFKELNRLGFKDSDFVTENLSARTQRQGYKDTLVSSVEYSGYFPLRDPSRYDELMKAMTDIGRVQVSIVDYSNRHLDEYMSQSFSQAFVAAKKEADMLLKPSGSSVGKVLRILKSGYDPFDKYDDPDKEMDNQRGSISHGVVTPTTPNYERIFRRKYFEIHQNITVMFEIQ